MTTCSKFCHKLDAIALAARRGRREGPCPVEATHRLGFGPDQAGQRRRTVPAGGLGVEQRTKNPERFLHDGGTVHKSGPRDRLLRTTRAYGVMDGLSLLRRATDFAKLQFLFETVFVPLWPPLAEAFLLVILLTVVTGMLGSRGVTTRPPLEVLRSEMYLKTCSLCRSTGDSS